MVHQVSPSLAKKEDTSDSMNARKRLPVALAGLVPRHRTGGKTSQPGPCWRFVQAMQGWFSTTGRMFLFVCLAALAVSFFPESAYGQRLLVSNFGKSTSGNTANNKDLAQAFSTGSNADGYILTSVSVSWRVNSNSNFTLSIYTDNSGAPGTSLGALTGTSGLNIYGSFEYTSSTGIELDPNTTYFLVLDLAGAVNIDWAYTSQNAEDSGKASGWSIANKYVSRARTSTGGWTDQNDVLKVRIDGYIKGTGITATLSPWAPVQRTGGRLHYRYDLKFSEAVLKSYMDMRDHVFTVTGGTIVKAKRIHKKTVFHKGERRMLSNHWRMEVRPDTDGGTVTVALTAYRICNQQGALCTRNGVPLSNEPSLTLDNSNATPSLRIENTSAHENSGWLRFKVIASYPSVMHYIEFDFNIVSGGTATAGADYVDLPHGQRHWFQRNQEEYGVNVRINDDSHNEGNETVHVQISNAQLVNEDGDVLETLTITGATAVGTIRNTDPIPLAFLGRLGRTAAVQVVEQVEERMRAPRESGLQARLAGQELRRGMERDVRHHFLSRLQAAAGASRTGVDSPAPMDTQAGLAGDELRRLGLRSGDMLTGSALEMNRQTHQGGTVSFWVRGLESQFTGQEDELSLKGGVRTTMLGADWVKGPLVAGLLLSHKGAVGDYSGVSAGAITSSLTGLHPWLGYQATERITLWGVTGYGRGALSVTPGAGATLDNGLSMAMAAGGLRGELVHSGVGGFGLAFKADALWVGTGTEGVISPTGNLAVVEATVTRFRTALETSRSYAFGRELSLEPSLEVGLRHDDGDAETGAGVDIAGSLIALNPLPGLSADVRVRTLLMHQAEGFQDRGVSVSFSYDSTPATPLGLTARLAPSWGGQTTSGAEALWGRETMAGLPGRLASGNRLEAELGYGQPVGRRLIGTPHFGVGASERGRDYRLGYSLTLSERSATNFEVGVDAQRRDSLSQGRVQHEVLGRITARW